MTDSEKRFWTVPNVLSLIRIAMIPLFVWCFFAGFENHRVWAIAIFLTVGATDVDCYQRLKPSRLLLYVQDISGLHSDRLGYTYDGMAKQGIFWAVIRHRVEVTRMPMEKETIRMETWPMPTTRVAYPRCTVA